MDPKTRIVEVTAENITEHPQAICFINLKNKFFYNKVDWLTQQIKNGLKIKLLYLEGEKKAVGFIEYLPGEFCWRAVNAKGYMFIHCLWITGKKYRKQGLGSLLIKEAEQDGQNMLGVTALTSDNSFMANKEIFLRNGYSMIHESGKDQLMLKIFKGGTLPFINDWKKELEKYKGITIIYSKQCPWVARFIDEVKPFLKKEKLEPTIIELKTAAEAQNAPSLYSVFNLIFNGKLLADRYISTTRFMNIVKNDIKRAK